MGINCTWQGELPSIIGFLTELQQKGVQYDVRTLNISPEGTKSGRLKGNMVIHCAYIKADKDSSEYRVLSNRCLSRKLLSPLE